MYTEYVFDDKKYEVATKNIKSILFDIVNAESSKLADIREKIAAADDSDLKTKLIELCNNHEKSLLEILSVSNNLNEKLETLDSFSRDLKFLENESLAEIVSNYLEQKNNTPVEQVNNEVAKTNVDENTVNEVNKPQVEEVANTNEEQVQEVKEEPVKPINNENEDSVVEVVSPDNQVEEAVAGDDGVAVEATEEQDNSVISEDATEPVITEEETKEEVVPASSEPEAVEEPVISEGEISIDTPTEPVISVPSEEAVEEPVINEGEIAVDAPTEPVIPVGEKQEEVPVVGEGEISIDTPTEPLIPIPVEDNSEASVAEPIINEGEISIDASAEPEIPAEEKQEDNAEEAPVVGEGEISIDAPTEPVIPVVEEKDSNESEDAPIVGDGEISIDTPAEPEMTAEEKQDDVVASPEIPTDETVASETVEKPTLNEGKVSIDGQDNSIPSPELTTDAPVVTGPVENEGEISIDAPTEPVIPTIVEGEGEDIVTFKKNDTTEPKAILTTANQVTNLRASRSQNESLLTAKQFFKFADGVENSTQVISTDVPVQQEVSKEEQMELMMQQMTQLYNEGRVEEAQVLSDKVSEMSKELQGNQKVLAA